MHNKTDLPLQDIEPLVTALTGIVLFGKDSDEKILSLVSTIDGMYLDLGETKGPKTIEQQERIRLAKYRNHRVPGLKIYRLENVFAAHLLTNTQRKGRSYDAVKTDVTLDTYQSFYSESFYDVFSQARAYIVETSGLGRLVFGGQQ